MLTWSMLLLVKLSTDHSIDRLSIDSSEQRIHRACDSLELVLCTIRAVSGTMLMWQLRSVHVCTYANSFFSDRTSRIEISREFCENLWKRNGTQDEHDLNVCKPRVSSLISYNKCASAEGIAISIRREWLWYWEKREVTEKNIYKVNKLIVGHEILLRCTLWSFSSTPKLLFAVIVARRSIHLKTRLLFLRPKEGKFYSRFLPWNRS